MLWLDDTADQGDIVATNHYCRPADSPAELCDARGFMVSGLGGRRVVLEGWGYTPEAQQLHGFEGRSFANQPAPWPERYELSQMAFEQPSAALTEQLRDDYGASWLVGLRRAGPVSPRIAEFADVAFDNGDVIIYRLRSTDED